MTSLRESADKTMKHSMGLKEGEKVLIIYDENTQEIAEALFNASMAITDKVKLVKIAVGKHHGEEPSDDIAEEMTKNDVIMLATTKSLSHTRARESACLKGARIASMPGITKEMMERTMDADYFKIADMTEKIFDNLKENSVVEITTEKGTKVSLKVMKRRKFSKPGLLHSKGDFGNLPAGEADLGVVEGTCHGDIVVDASMAGVGKVTEPILIRAKRGKVYEIMGGKEAKVLKNLLEEANDDRVYHIAEIGIGTNDMAEVSGAVLEDEKALGTAHLALGNNITYGGSVDVPLHLDGVMFEPTIIVDGKVLMEKGKILI